MRHYSFVCALGEEQECPSSLNELIGAEWSIVDSYDADRDSVVPELDGFL